MNRGILSASTEFDETDIQTMLPPDHRIVATARPIDQRRIDYMIEGASMPAAISHVTLLCTRTTVDGETTTRAYWDHDRSVQWIVPTLPVKEKGSLFETVSAVTGYRKGFAE